MYTQLSCEALHQVWVEQWRVFKGFNIFSNIYLWLLYTSYINKCYVLLLLLTVPKKDQLQALDINITNMLEWACLAFTMPLITNLGSFFACFTGWKMESTLLCIQIHNVLQVQDFRPCEGPSWQRYLSIYDQRLWTAEWSVTFLQELLSWPSWYRIY